MTGNVGFTQDDSYGDLASDVVNNTVVEIRIRGTRTAFPTITFH